MAKRDGNDTKPERSLADCMRQLLRNQTAADVCFEVGPPGGETVKFRAHKYFLMTRSEVFEGMFSSGMVECSNGAEAKVRVEDIDADVFQQLLDYMYCEETQIISPESAGCLIYAAKKYMLPKLVTECCNCLLENLDLSNAIQVLDHSLHFDEPQLQEACIRWISSNAKDILTGAEILSASPLVMKTILQSRHFLAKESVVYEVAVKWAKHQLKTSIPEESPTDLQIREQLGDILYEIRFPAMKLTDFAEMSAESNILSDKEKVAIYYFLATGKTIGELKFPTDLRRGEEVWVDRATSCHKCEWIITPCFDAINFTSNRDVLLTGIGLFTAFNEGGYEADVELLQGTKSLFKAKVTAPYFADANQCKVILNKPIIILAEVLHSVKSLPSAAIGYYGSACRERCCKEGVSFTFTKHSESAYTSATYGQIPRLYFCVM